MRALSKTSSAVIQTSWCGFPSSLTRFVHLPPRDYCIISYVFKLWITRYLRRVKICVSYPFFLKECNHLVELPYIMHLILMKKCLELTLQWLWHSLKQLNSDRGHSVGITGSSEPSHSNLKVCYVMLCHVLLWIRTHLIWIFSWGLWCQPLCSTYCHTFIHWKDEECRVSCNPFIYLK